MMHTGSKTDMENCCKHIFITAALIFINAYTCCCQKTGKVEILVQDARITTLVAKHIAFNENRGTIKGFRVQIFFDSGNNSKSRAVTAMNDFKAKYSNVEAYLMFQEPNYKVRVGDFRTRMDAQRLLNVIYEDFPTAFVVKDDEINFPSLDTNYGD